MRSVRRIRVCDALSVKDICGGPDAALGTPSAGGKFHFFAPPPHKPELADMARFMVYACSTGGTLLHAYLHQRRRTEWRLAWKQLRQSSESCLPHRHHRCFGGCKLVEAGQHQVYPLAEHPIMGIWRAVKAVPHFYRIFRMAKQHFETHRPDAVVLVDYPGFHWHLAKAAHQRGIPVYWFVPPQIWAWATHRVKWMKKSVDHVFCNLPFETEWYQKKGMPCSFIGHPYFDAMSQQRLDESFIYEQRSRPERIVALLPGSRGHEVQDNVPMMLNAARLVHQQVPDTRFLVAGFKTKQAEVIREQLVNYPELPIEVHVGRTPEIINLATVCLSVSGSVSLELLNASLPTVTVYKIGQILFRLVSIFKHAKYISLINLLADCVVTPEFLTNKDESKPMSEQLIAWLKDEPSRLVVKQQMQQIKAGIARPGACQRAVEHLLSTLQTRGKAAA